MDPVFFEINWERTLESLTLIVILAFVVERALTIVFENNFYEATLSKLHIKPLFAFIVSFVICYYWEFDVLSIILVKSSMTSFGYVITAAVIAGGSKGALQLLRNVRMLKENKEQEVQTTTK